MSGGMVLSKWKASDILAVAGYVCLIIGLFGVDWRLGLCVAGGILLAIGLLGVWWNA